LRPIKQGQRQGEWVVIDDGVAACERVVTTGQKFVFPGAPVHVANAAPATEAPGSAPSAAAEGAVK